MSEIESLVQHSGGLPPAGRGVPVPVRHPAGTLMRPAVRLDEVRCVIVDDNDRFVELASALLRGEGFDVVGVAGDSAQALRLVAEVSPDVALIDLNLGQDNGIEVIADIVGAGLAATVVTILVSTCAVDDLRDLAGLSEADAYLSKTDLSSSTIRRILRGSGIGNGG